MVPEHNVSAGRRTRSWTRGGTLALFLLLLSGLLIPAPATANRQPSAAEFGQIRSALKGHLAGGYYCPRRSLTRVSGRNPRWAVAEARSNCGIGSQTVRFFVSRPSAKSNRWRFRLFRFQKLGPGGLTPCGTRVIPRDIRCGFR
jgi:hypothetical protein